MPVFLYVCGICAKLGLQGHFSSCPYVCTTTPLVGPPHPSHSPSPALARALSLLTQPFRESKVSVHASPFLFASHRYAVVRPAHRRVAPFLF
eukprot:1207694-Pleurochrysis_carterae.AAC.1